MQRSRKSFDGVRKALRAKNIQYYTMFPAKLKIILNGRAEFFSDPEKAMEFIEKIRDRPDARSSSDPD